MGTPTSNQLAADRGLVRDARTITTIKDVAKRYNLTLEGTPSFLTAQNKVLEHLDNLAKTPSSCHDQGSTAAKPAMSLRDSQERCSPVQGRRLSYSQALGQRQKGSGLTPLGKVRRPVPAEPKMRSMASLLKPSPVSSGAADTGEGSLFPSPGPEGASTSATASPVHWHPPSPAFEEQQPPAAQQPAAKLAAKKAAAKKVTKQRTPNPPAPTQPDRAGDLREAQQPSGGEKQQGACNSSSSSITALQERVASLEELVHQQKVTFALQLAAVTAQLTALRQQQQTSQATGFSAAQGVSTLKNAVDRLQDQAAHGKKLEEAVGRLSSQQQKLAEQQELEECQRSVILKVPQQLPPSQPPAAAAEDLLCTKLGIEVSVLRARPLTQYQQKRGGEPSSRTSYKVLLASSGERDAVLRAKAQRLKGTQISVDVLLTKQQQARRKALLPDAKRAAAAGQRVQWRYDRLYIDGKECRGEGSLPESRPQQQSDAAAEGEGWQVVRSRRRQTPPGEEPTAPATSSQQEEGEIPATAGGTNPGQSNKRRRRQPKQATAPADSPATSPQACQHEGETSQQAGKAAQQQRGSGGAAQKQRGGGGATQQQRHGSAAAQKQSSGGGGCQKPRQPSSPPRA